MKKNFLSLSVCVIPLFIFAQTPKQTLKVGTFNIQNFGQTKLSKAKIVDTLATVVRMFDVIAVQEISDTKNTVASSFLTKINNNGKYHYKVAFSVRTGQQLANKLSQEQYAFYYNSDILVVTDTFLFNDRKNDLFKREPYIAQFKTVKGNFKFVVITIHTTPELAVKEIGSLYDVGTWLPQKIKNSNIIFCGDFDGSYTYASPADLAKLKIHQKPYNWIIPDTAKTNLSTSQNCAYDRFVVTDSLFPKVTKWFVVHYFKSKEVSDHYPVSIEIQY